MKKKVQVIKHAYEYKDLNHALYKITVVMKNFKIRGCISEWRYV